VAARDLFPPEGVQNGSAAHLATYSKHNKYLTPGSECENSPYIMQMLRMSGVLTPLSHAFMACTGTDLLY
jgi:hypothetical protein